VKLEMTTALAMVMACVARPVGGQVGSMPDRSPYKDLEYKHEATVYGGQYSAGRDPAGVAPGDGTIIGLRYDLHLGGPAYLTLNGARISSERTLLDPRKPAVTRLVGSQTWPVYLAELGLSLNLTGMKSYHHIVPVVNGGLGVASDLKPTGDVGGYVFGTPFALSYGLGIKWVSSGRLQFRVDGGNHLYQIKYPSSYFLAASDGSRILPDTQGRTVWKSNYALTLGASYLLFR
jgi:hypothetical protein